MSMAELKQRLSALPRDSVVFYLSFFRDSTGRTFSPGEAIPQISIAANAPVYGSSDYMLGYGIVGGHLENAYQQGKLAAQLAKKILDGSAADQLPVITEGLHSYMFDFRQLQRFGIALSDLPADSTIVDEPDTFYYRYKKFIWPVLAVFALMVVYIGVLRFNISKRKKAQRGLQHILDQANTLFELDSLETFSRDLKARLAEMVPVKGDILLFKYADAGAPFAAAKLFPIGDEAGPAPLPASQALLQKAVETKRCAYADQELVVFFDNEAMPVNLAHMRTDKRLDDIDRRLLEILAGNVAVGIDNIEKYKLLESLVTARKIQESMLPTAFAAVSGPYHIDLHAQLLPAKAVSGDLYNFFAIDQDRLCVVVGDVSDKGMPSALFMAMTQTLICSTAEIHAEPEAILAKVNNTLCRDNDMSMFVTLFVAVFSRSTGATGLRQRRP